ncbi:hypothetical protein P0082_00945 [Candidatus Haliotispira prima]|uniref:Uncharacterized protein n=1 Tax=Candidatus Haliotispira prima TaxID=3034016 RepID=A0ABY8MHF3_9SPIO|nr:hypothetical protein P0082_00945 [Candidatus Haliotispira prima]
MASYLELREALRSELVSKLSVSVSNHNGSFSEQDSKNLSLNPGDEVLLAMDAVNQNSARFRIYIKTRNSGSHSADVRALGLILQVQKILQVWKHKLIAKRISSTWEQLPDNILADMNVYIYRVSAELPIYQEDYLEDYLEEKSNGN